MLLGFTNGLFLVSNLVFILGYTDGEVFWSTDTVPDGFIVGIDIGNRLSSLNGSTDDCNDGNTEVSLLGISLVLDNGSVLCSSGDFYYVTKDGMFVGWIQEVLLECTDGLVLGYNVGFILESTDGEMLGFSVVLPDEFMVY